MQQQRRSEGCHCRKVDSKSSFSIFVRICSTKRATRRPLHLLLFDEAFTHQLVHRRLREGRAADPDVRAE